MTANAEDHKANSVLGRSSGCSSHSHIDMCMRKHIFIHPYTHMCTYPQAYRNSCHTNTHSVCLAYSDLKEKHTARHEHPHILQHIRYIHTHGETYKYCSEPTVSNSTSAKKNISILSGFQTRLHQLLTQPTCSRA